MLNVKILAQPKVECQVCANNVAFGLTEMVHCGVVNVQVLERHLVIIHHIRLLVFLLLNYFLSIFVEDLLDGDNEKVDSIGVELFL